MSQARFELKNPIQTVTSPNITLVQKGSSYLLNFSILITGKDLPNPPPSPDPEATTHRDINLASPLFLGSHRLTITSPAGVDSSLLQLEAIIDSKIPGTGGFAFIRKKTAKKKRK